MNKYYLIIDCDSLNKDGNFLTYKVLAEGTLLQMAKRRKDSAELVVDSNGNIVSDVRWLFDWERKLLNKEGFGSHAIDAIKNKLSFKLEKVFFKFDC